MRRRPLLVGGCVVVAAALAPAAVAIGPGGDRPAKPVNENACAGGVKLDPVVDGAYELTLDGSTLRVTLDVDEAAQTYSFTTDRPVGAVRTKGGPGAEIVTFDAPVTSGEGLHAPLNPRSGKYYGLSHVCLFGADDGEEPPGEFLLDDPVTEEPADPPEDEGPGVFSF
ncbi:MAG: hypothetical protein K2X91_14735 [Thermoleophilia bacterium]|nr:hypothetical protein [Thermoleophilia bacterium]